MIDSEKGSSGDRLRLLLGSWRSLVHKIDPSRSRLTFRTQALYWLNGATQSFLHGLQKKSYADALAKIVPPAPVFVLGFWRSGTTLLHELLCCDTRFGFPSTYACLNPAHFLLSERWAHSIDQQQVRRAMDDLRYSWASPQEDEFALLGLGAPSPYEALIVPSLLSDVTQLLDLRARSASDQRLWRATLRYFLTALTLQQAKPMVLKSPTHGYRMQILREEFPEARYALIERNPYEVFASNVKLWRTLTGRYGLEQCTGDEVEEFVLAAYLLHENMVFEGVRNAKPGSVAQVRYEDLVRDPVEQLTLVYAKLGLGDLGAVRPDIDAYLAKVSGHQRNRFRLTRKQKERIDAAWGAVIKDKDYSWPSSYIDLD